MDAEKIKKTYERAEKLKDRGDFDKAYSLYKDIADANDDVQAFWGMLLCKYGVADPGQPVIKRPSPDSILEDEAFELIMENAQGDERSFYRKTAKELEKLRRAVVSKAEEIDPSDVYICCMAEEDGQPTAESVFAGSIAEALKDDYKVFVSKDMDEAAVYAALSTSKVMICAGTDYDHFYDPDVRNEWASFMGFTPDNYTKLICVYKDCDELDLPKEFSKCVQIELEGDDVSVAAAAARKILESYSEKAQTQDYDTALTSSDIQTAALLKRGFMALEDGDFEKADEFFEKVLNIDPECPQGYWGKSLCVEKVRDADEFAKSLFEKITGNKETNKVEIPGPDLVELARAADMEKGLLEEFEDMEIYRLIQDLETNVSYEDSSSYFEDQAEIMSAETVRKLIDNRDYDRAVRYADDETRDHISKLFENVSSALKNVLNIEKAKAADAAREAEKAKDEILGIIKKRLENVASGMDSRRAVICALSPGMKKIMEILEDIKEDDTFEFGNYFINETEKAPVIWRVLKRETDRALLVTECGIDTLPYHDTRSSITWEKSFIRHYMNNEMIKELFTDEERSVLLKVINENPRNEEFETYGGKPTEDTLFLFSAKEAEEWFKDDDIRCARATPYARDKGARVNESSGTAWWWLRTPGNASNTAARVASFGYVIEDGYYVNYDGCVIRPGVWVDLSWTKENILKENKK